MRNLQQDLDGGRPQLRWLQNEQDVVNKQPCEKDVNMTTRVFCGTLRWGGTAWRNMACLKFSESSGIYSMFTMLKSPASRDTEARFFAFANTPEGKQTANAKTRLRGWSQCQGWERRHRASTWLPDALYLRWNPTLYVMNSERDAIRHEFVKFYMLIQTARSHLCQNTQ